MVRLLRRAMLNASLVSGSILVSLLFGEVFVRVTDPGHIGSKHQRLFVEYDPQLGWRKIANVSRTFETPEYRVVETINSQGFRGPEYSYAKDADEFRILVLGDSFTEGYTVEFEELFSEVMERRLNASSGPTRFEVINAGTGGYSTDQELLLFRGEGKKYRPDLTVLMFYSNDVWANTQEQIWRGFKPRFDLDEAGELSLVNSPVPRPESLLAELSPLRRAATEAKWWLRSNSRLYRFTRERIRGNAGLHRIGIRLGLMEATAEEGAEDGGARLVPVPKVFMVFQKDANERVEEAWRVTEALVGELAKEADAIDSDFLVFHVPHRAKVHREEWKTLKEQYEISGEDWSIDHVEARLSEVCERNRLECLTPGAAFEAEVEREASGRLYFPLDGHWNAAGHRLAGEILAEHIQRSREARQAAIR